MVSFTCSITLRDSDYLILADHAKNKDASVPALIREIVQDYIRELTEPGKD